MNPAVDGPTDRSTSNRVPTLQPQPQMPAFLQSSRAGRLALFSLHIQLLGAYRHPACKLSTNRIFADIRNKFVDLEWQQRNRLAPTEKNEQSEFGRVTGDHISVLNRYIDIDPYRSNRVKLKVPAGQNDYINASTIVLKHTRSGKVKRYIATQGPKQSSFSHIWRMVWHETGPVAVIIMLTQTHESGREKCYQYFPVDTAQPTLQINAQDEFGDREKATVTLVETTYDERARCQVRKLHMHVGSRSKIVYHLLFVGWPDYLVPEGDDRIALLELVRLSARLNQQDVGGGGGGGDGLPESNPRIVHCSAGVGRSGTFIALDYLLGELEEGSLERVGADEDRIVQTVDALRRQRMMMVQGEAQMRFLYEVLKEQWMLAREVQEQRR